MTLEISKASPTVRAPWSYRLATALVSLVMTIALVEGAARILSGQNILHYYKPLESQIDPQTEDWRWTHTFDDEHFEPDHQLFWRPKVNHFPFDAYGNAVVEGQSPVVIKSQQPKIMIYGDSNTQGLATSSWAFELQNRLSAARSPMVVLNRGVVGYSSFQGVGRLKRDLKTYQPQVIIFAFGWNDAAPAINAPDPYFSPYPGMGGGLLARSRAYAIGVYYANEFRGSLSNNQQLRQTTPRMTSDQYIQKLKEMYILAEQHGAIPIIVTRPFDSTNPDFSDETNWRSRIPLYNQAVRELMKDDAKHLVDFEEYFRSRPELFIDESHFSPEGHREASDVLWRTLNEVL